MTTDLRDLTFRIRGMPARLHRRWKSLAAERGMSMNDAVIEALEDWTHRMEDIVAKANEREESRAI